MAPLGSTNWGVCLPIGRNGFWQWIAVCCRAVACLLLALLPMLPAISGPGGPHYTVTGWNTENGLPHPLVHVVAQDRNGFLWAGTWEGVVRFNGRSFTLFDRQNTPGVEFAGVFSILPEDDGGVLFGTARAGVFRYYQGHWQRLGDATARTLAVQAIQRDLRDGSLWLASGQRLLRMDRRGVVQDVGAALGLPAKAITSLARENEGGLLVGGEAGLYRIKDGHAQHLGADWGGTQVVRSVRRDGAGGWLIAGDDGVYWRHADGRIEHMDAGQRVDAVVRDAQDALWINQSAGSLIRLDKDGTRERMPIAGTVSKALLLDREGMVWVGSTDGLYRVSESMASGLTRKQGLGSDYVRVVLQADDGSNWIGTTNGLNHWVQGRMQTVRLLPGQGEHDTSVLALAWRAGALWVGTYDQGVFRLDGQGHVQQHIRLGDGVQPLIRALLPEADGSVWIGGNHGLVLYKDGQITLRVGKSDTRAAVVQTLYRDPNGPLWVGSDDGMMTLDAAGKQQRWRPDIDLPAQYVFDFLRDPQGDLWIATDRGLLRMRGGRFRVYDHRVGLPRDKVFRIIDDHAGNFWLSSNMGVFRVARRELDEIDTGQRHLLAVHVVDKSDGMPGSQCNGASMPAGWRAADGNLLFPTSAGLAQIDPVRANNGTRAGPPVAFESIAVDGVQQRIGSSLRLLPGMSRLSIGYAGMSFRAPDKLRYRYRLHGYEQKWVDAGSSTDAVYTRLPPGSYQFEVQAMAMPLDWSQTAEIGVATLAINVQPALWQRRWVQALASGLLVACILLVLWARMASYRRSQRRLSQVIAERTEELSEKNRQLEVASWRLQYQASHDELTALYNRRAGDRNLILAVERAHAAGHSLCVALLDIDRFKQVNDSHGHAAGDAVLQAFGEELAAFAAEWGVMVARFGGEEFLVCLEEFQLSAATQRIEELLLRITRREVPLDNGATLHCTFSAGIAELMPGQSAHALLAQADDRLLQAKQAGRNRVMGAASA